MRMVILSLCVMVCLGGKSTDRDNEPDSNNNVCSDNDYSPCLNSNLEAQMKEDFKTTVEELFGNSLTYLYTSYKYADQKKEKPGLAKYLKKMSDETWEEGMVYIKKYQERGGNWDNNLVINAKDLTETNNERNSETEIYVHTLKETLKNVKKVANLNNSLHKKAVENEHKSTEGQEETGYHDAEFTRFFMDKMHENTEKIRELAGHIVDLGRMESGLALDIFDSNL